MKLFDIDQAVLAIENGSDWLDEDTGELFSIDNLDDLMMERERKIRNIACWIKNLDSDIEEMKRLEAETAERRRRRQNKHDRLKLLLSDFLDGKSWSSPEADVSFRRTEKVMVIDMKSVPEEYLNVKTDIAVDKNAVKKAIKDGIDVGGCELFSSRSMSVK